MIIYSDSFRTVHRPKSDQPEAGSVAYVTTFGMLPLAAIHLVVMNSNTENPAFVALIATTPVVLAEPPDVLPIFVAIEE